MSYLLVLSTVSSPKEARQIARHLLHRKLAACVNLVPGIESHYWWKGRLETGKEVLLLIKTTARRFALLQKEIKKKHSYAVPEIIAFSIKKGHPDYLRWIGQSIKKPCH